MPSPYIWIPLAIGIVATVGFFTPGSNSDVEIEEFSVTHTPPGAQTQTRSAPFQLDSALTEREQAADMVGFLLTQDVSNADRARLLELQQVLSN